jgi:LmbE family N-acetylglucosaminyl deacetylase
VRATDPSTTTTPDPAEETTPVRSTLPQPHPAPPGRALVVVAHPDDAEFWAGGTIAVWCDEGTHVSYLVLTDGDAGGFDPAVARADIPAIRRAEQRQAAAVLGVTDVEFLGHREGSLTTPGNDLHLQLVRAIRRTRPHRVITWSPEWNWARFRSCHPDHLATGTATLHAIYPDAGNAFAHPTLTEIEGLAPWTVAEIWLLNSPHVNHFVDITATFDRKVAAVAAHPSQTAPHPDLAAHLRRRIEDNTALAGLAPDRLAESFQVVYNR